MKVHTTTTNHPKPGYATYPSKPINLCSTASVRHPQIFAITWDLILTAPLLPNGPFQFRAQPQFTCLLQSKPWYPQNRSMLVTKPFDVIIMGFASTWSERITLEDHRY